MAWEKPSADLMKLFDALVPSDPTIVRKKMFGCPAAFVDGKLFAGVHQQTMIFRLGPADFAAFLELPNAQQFEPMAGHKMSGYVAHHAPFSLDEAELENWMTCALTYTLTLPAKAGKAAKKKAVVRKTAVASKKAPAAKSAAKKSATKKRSA